MVLTRQQAYILDLLNKTKCMKISQLQWFLHRTYSITNEHFEHQIFQLRYLNQVWLDGQFILLPERKRDDELIAAIDIMLCFCGEGIPSFAVGTPPCKLLFFVPMEDEKVSVFKLFFVPLGHEIIVSLEAQKQNQPPNHTLLFFLQNKEQIPKFQTEQAAYFVMKNNDGGYEFYK